MKSVTSRVLIQRDKYVSRVTLDKLSMTAIITFFVSLLGILGLLYLKQKELARGQSVFSPALLQFGEVVEAKALSLARALERLFTKETMRLLLIPIRRFFVGLLVSFQRAFNNYFSRFVNLIRGRGTLSNRGEASAFLKDISEYKESQKEFFHDAEKM